MRRKAPELPPEPRRPGRPLTDHDRRLGAETARTLQDLQAIRADLFCEYLFLGSHLPPPEELPEPTAGALAAAQYWQDRRGLLLIREPRRKPESGCGRTRFCRNICVRFVARSLTSRNISVN